MQDQQPYIPASKPVLTPGQEAPLSLVAYNLGSGDIKAQAKVLSLDGKEMGAGDLKLLGSESRLALPPQGELPAAGPAAGRVPPAGDPAGPERRHPLQHDGVQRGEWGEGHAVS